MMMINDAFNSPTHIQNTNIVKVNSDFSEPLPVLTIKPTSILNLLFLQLVKLHHSWLLYTLYLGF